MKIQDIDRVSRLGRELRGVKENIEKLGKLLDPGLLKHHSISVYHLQFEIPAETTVDDHELAGIIQLMRQGAERRVAEIEAELKLLGVETEAVA